MTCVVFITTFAHPLISLLSQKWNTQAVRGDTRLDMEMTKLWISRARAVPVSIRLECSVGWRNTYIPPTPKMVTDLLAVAQISTLILGIELSVQHCVEILSCCSQIINCSFLQVTLSSDVPIIVRNPIALRRLRSLWLRTNGDLGLLFSHITLPRLTTLSVEYLNPWDGDFWPQPEFASLVSRSACSLQKLRIHRVTMTSDKLTACLSCAPSITQVSIIDRADGLDDALLTAMTAKPNSQPLNPRLEVIRFSGRAYADKVLVNMIESRWRPGKALTATTSQTSSHVSRLKVVRVRVRAKLGDSWQRLQKFHTEGLDTMGSDVDVISS